MSRLQAILGPIGQEVSKYCKRGFDPRFLGNAAKERRRRHTFELTIALVVASDGTPFPHFLAHPIRENAPR
jgi:hypothetical protein